MEPKFKAGDFVRVVKENMWIPVGQEGRITEIDCRNNRLRMATPVSGNLWMSPDHLELVSRQIDKNKINEVLAKYPGAEDALKELFPDSFQPELVSFGGSEAALSLLSKKVFGDPYAIQVVNDWAFGFPEYLGKCLGVSSRFNVSLESINDCTIVVITKKQT